MKINNDCARKVLIEVEKIPFGETITAEKLSEKISEFNLEEVLHILTQFNKFNYLYVIDKASYDDNDVLRDNKVKMLSERGYRALDTIRDDEIWNIIKTKLDNFDEISIFTIFTIANKINNNNFKELFELPEFYYDYKRY